MQISNDMIKYKLHSSLGEIDKHEIEKTKENFMAKSRGLKTEVPKSVCIQYISCHMDFTGRVCKSTVLFRLAYSAC